MSIEITLPPQALTNRIIERIREGTAESLQNGSVIIKMDGQRIKTHSGKSIWPSIGAAKNAWANHIDGVIYRLKGNEETLLSQELECENRSGYIRKEITQYMINQHILQFIKIGESNESEHIGEKG